MKRIALSIAIGCLVSPDVCLATGIMLPKDRGLPPLAIKHQRVNVAIRLDERPEPLGVGFRVYVRIFHDEATDALVVPRTCLFRADAGEWRVMLVRAGKVATQAVEVGLMNDDLAQITSGLSGDDKVVLRPSREIENGMRVEVEQRG